MLICETIAFALLGLGGLSYGLIEWLGQRRQQHGRGWTVIGSSVASLCIVIGSTLFILAR